MSLRARLTAFYVSLLALLLLILGGAMYINLQNFLLESTAARLRAQARPILDNTQRNPQGRGPFGRNPPDPPFEVTARALARELPARDISVRILDTKGTLVAEDRSLDIQPPAPEVVDSDHLTRALTGDSNVSFPVNTSAGRSLIVLVPLKNRSGQVNGIVEMSTPLDAADEILMGQRNGLVIAILATMLIGALGGILFTGAALQPLERIVGVTRRIAAGDLSQRAHLGQRRDEIGQLGASFDAMLDRLEASFAAQRQFVADASHELRTPLTAFKGSLEVLMRGAVSDPATAGQTLRSMYREAERMSRLIADLLTLSRLDARPNLRISQVDLHNLTHEVAEQTRLLARPDQSVIVEPGEPLLAPADADRMRQVLLNLGENATKFTPAGGRICFASERHDGYAILRVSDSGVGLAPEDLPHVFERFYRADKARTRSGVTTSGSGLGLSIAQAIVQAHGGRIEVQSTPDSGSEFSVWLPLAKHEA